MLRAIRKFVFRRDRDEGQGPEVVAEDDASSDEAVNPDDPLPPAGQESEGPSEMPVRGQVKWFNPAKRFGFVELSDGSGDAFLHVSVLSRLGIDTVQPGETLELRVAPGSGVQLLSRSSGWTAARRSRSTALERVPLPRTTERSRRRVSRRRVR